MSKPTHDSAKPITIQVSTGERPDFKQPLAAYVYDKGRKEAQRIEIRDGKFELAMPEEGMGHTRLLIAPMNERIEAAKPSADRLRRLGAYEPVLPRGRDPIIRIDVPGPVLDWWPFCFCWVHGKVVRKSDNRAVCNARVHICEVDRIPLWILKLPDPDIFRLRDDLIKVIERPPIPILGPGPRRAAMPFDPQPDPPAEMAMPSSFVRTLRSNSSELLRNALAENWKLLVPWLCHWPHWWWLFRCDEMAVVMTDEYGNFEATLFYRCGGDHPDLYFWVEYDFGSGYEVVYRPSKYCHTYWNYQCGSEVTIRVTDPRVPGCDREPDLPGRQVVVLSIGRGIAVQTVQQGPAKEGQTAEGYPFGGTLEPRVDFSRTELISLGIPYYRWSYRRLTGPDGSDPVLDTPKAMIPDVFRHYKSGSSSYPSYQVGPMPISGPDAAPMPNLFRIHPAASPSGQEWYVVDEHVDLATAYFHTQLLEGAPSGPEPDDDLAAGKYEIRLELFDTAGNLVNWTDAGIELKVPTVPAPFGTTDVTAALAGPYYRILSADGKTMGFRMVVRVDNNRCRADIHPVGGTVSPDAACGFHNYGSPGDTAMLSFLARHPNNFATYAFSAVRGDGPALGVTVTGGAVGAPGNDGYLLSGAFTYAKSIPVSALLGECPNAAFSETLTVAATATDGYSTLSGYNMTNHAGFALAKPCPACG